LSILPKLRNKTAISGHALDQLERAKWRFWNGQAERGLIGLVHLRQWARARCFEHIPTTRKAGQCAAEHNPLLGIECRFNLGNHPKAANGYHLKSGQRKI
jgi:hypothetical protein